MALPPAPVLTVAPLLATMLPPLAVPAAAALPALSTMALAPLAVVLTSLARVRSPLVVLSCSAPVPARPATPSTVPTVKAPACCSVRLPTSPATVPTALPLPARLKAPPPCRLRLPACTPAAACSVTAPAVFSVTLLLPAFSTPLSWMAPLADCSVSGSCTVTALALMVPVPSVRPTTMRPKPSAAALVKKLAGSCRSPGAPAMPMLVEAVCGATASVPLDDSTVPLATARRSVISVMSEVEFVTVPSGPVPLPTWVGTANSMPLPTVPAPVGLPRLPLTVMGPLADTRLLLPVPPKRTPDWFTGLPLP